LLPLTLPEVSEARGGAEFEGLGLLVLGDADGVLETGFCFSLIGCILLEQEFALEAIQLGLAPPISFCIDTRQCFREYCESCLCPKLPRATNQQLFVTQGNRAILVLQT
jgi:hypothetical protein